MTEGLLRTPLYDDHARLGAKFTPFAGYDMPVLYTGVIEEHRLVRSGVGIFDVSHMGEVFCSGPGAEAYLQRLTCNDVARIPIGRAQYSILTNETGGAVDDIIIYRRGTDSYLVCVNAANVEKDFRWMSSHRAGYDVEIENRSDEYAQIAVQGPLADRVMDRLYPGLSHARKELPLFAFREVAWKSGGQSWDTIVARTGYTGEDGFEIFMPNSAASPFWNALLEHGAADGLRACGLGARDTLRLEAALPLYGHELRDDLNIAASNVAWTIKCEKGDFIGREHVQGVLQNGAARKLCGLEILDPGIVRDGAVLYSGASEVGFVTSGTKTPTVNKSIAMAYLDAELARSGMEVSADVRGRHLKAKVVDLPFYRRPKVS